MFLNQLFRKKVRFFRKTKNPLLIDEHFPGIAKKAERFTEMMKNT